MFGKKSKLKVAVPEQSKEDAFREEIKQIFLERKMKGLVVVINEDDAVVFSWANIFQGRALDALAKSTAILREMLYQNRS